MKRKNIALFFALFAMLLMASCGGKDIKPAEPQMPEWCMKTSGVIINADRGKLVVGVGAVSGIKSPAMARANADGQARAEIAKIFSSYTENLLKQYQRSTAADGQVSEEQDFMQATRIFTKMNVVGAAIEDRYFDVKSETFYSKAVIDFGKFNELINNNNELSSKVRDFVRSNADDAFKQLDEIAERNAAEGQ